LLVGGKRIEPTGRYECREHSSIKGLVSVYWIPEHGAPDPRPLLNLGPSAVPLLAEALAEWELAHHVPEPRPAPGLRIVNDDGEI
jgi:hypothetical protein